MLGVNMFGDDILFINMEFFNDLSGLPYLARITNRVKDFVNKKSALVNF